MEPHQQIPETLNLSHGQNHKNRINKPKLKTTVNHLKIQLNQNFLLTREPTRCAYQIERGWDENTTIKFRFAMCMSLCLCLCSFLCLHVCILPVAIPRGIPKSPSTKIFMKKDKQKPRQTI